jgi:hypothetical protein
MEVKKKKVKDLKKELEILKKKIEEEQEVKRLKKQINIEKFNQTKTGRIFNKIADFGDGAKKKLFTPQKKDNKIVKKPMDINELIKRLPQ